MSQNLKRSCRAEHHQAASDHRFDVARRPASQVCRLERMGAAFPTRLSFMRLLLRRMQKEHWSIERPKFALDEQGFGRAVYRVRTKDRTYSLVAFANPLAADQRTDRVIASAWDAAFVLFDGDPQEADLDRLEANAPHQEAGRFHATDLVISRANRSIRLFEYVCDSLANGRQPDPQRILDVGYLMRTTAVYGNGKFGVSDRSRVVRREEAQNSFHIEMLTVYLIRLFTFDQLEHIASCRAPGRSVPLEPALKRMLGIGNATGLGMAPFVVSHPELMHQWFAARETALARIRNLSGIKTPSIDRAVHLTRRALLHLEQWPLDDEAYKQRNAQLRQDLEVILKWLMECDETELTEQYWDQLVFKSEQELCVDAQELLVALLIEVYPDVIDGLDDAFCASETRPLNVSQRVGEFRAFLDARYGWTDRFDFKSDEQNQHFWYVSENKLEPRFGNRQTDSGAEQEMPVAIARDIARLRKALKDYDPEETLAQFLLDMPRYRHLVRRAQSAGALEYAEIQDNLIAKGTSPLDILRFKLACFGAAKFDPKSSLWTRITMFQGAPLPDEIASDSADDWWLSTLPSVH